MKKVLFVCVGNASRSQMAEAFFNSISKNARASSAGTKPAERISSRAVQVMKEAGIDMSGGRPKPLTHEMIHDADIIVTMGCGVSGVCPATVATEDWGLPDTVDQPIEKYREVRDLVKRKVEKLVEDNR